MTENVVAILKNCRRYDGKVAAKKAYAVATFGELRGGNLTLVSSSDAELASWTVEGQILATRHGHWDNATLSAGPAPQQLSDGHSIFIRCCNV